MRWLAIFIFLSLAVSVLAADPPKLCTDSDNGGGDSNDVALETKGNVKYGITPMYDTCLTSRDGVSIETGVWLREYFCNSQDQRKSEVYDCVRQGYDKCYAGACVKTSSSANTSTTRRTTNVPQNSCGNDIVEKDKGESCDPPGEICFGRSSAEYGTCNSKCTCDIAKAALEKRVVSCGDGYVDSPEECETDDNCEDNAVCSSCSCVKELSAEEIEQMKDSARPKKEDKKEESSEQPETVEEETIDLEGKNFEESATIKATSAITDFFRSLFGWLFK